MIPLRINLDVDEMPAPAAAIAESLKHLTQVG